MRVLLVNMPWVAVTRPAIGVSLLKALLVERGIECTVAYGNVRFAGAAGLDAYTLINDGFPTGIFAGDWLFAQHLFGDAVDLEGYARLLRATVGDQLHDKVMDLRALVGPFLEECYREFDPASYDVIGFTTTFEQNLASLAFSKLIKQRQPEQVIVFGGANCDGPMGQELHRSFPWIDYVVSGEADRVFPELMSRLATGMPVPQLPNVIARVEGVSRPGLPSQPIQDMDALPVPEYDDYFSALSSAPFATEFKPMLPIESARGCWWGAKQHCTFCGLNAETMAFRAKSAPRVLAELEQLSRRYGLHRFMVVDNILPHEYFKTLLPELKQRQLGVSLFYEVKANLKREQVELMRDAGIKAVQPGIESLSTPVLRIMRKGITGLQNVQMLRLCREYGIQPIWNLLYGFPGETAEHYADMAGLLSGLYHLTAPTGAARIRLDRFSPNFNQAAELGLVNVRPFDSYRHLYPLEPERIANLAYFFLYDYADGRDPSSYMTETERHVKIWHDNKRLRGDLVMEWAPAATLVLVDTRPERPPKRHELRGLEREIYELCSEIKSRANLLAHVRACAVTPDHEDVRTHTPEAWLEEFLQRMLADQLMLREGDQYLSVAVNPSFQDQRRQQKREALKALMAAFS